MQSALMLPRLSSRNPLRTTIGHHARTVMGIHGMTARHQQEQVQPVDTAEIAYSGHGHWGIRGVHPPSPQSGTRSDLLAQQASTWGSGGNSLRGGRGARILHIRI